MSATVAPEVGISPEGAQDPKGKKKGVCACLSDTVVIDPLVKQLDGGLVIYSRDAWSDLWLSLKNQHIVLSAWLCHPNHTLNKRDRTRLAFMSLILAYGFFALIESIQEAAARFWLNIILGVFFQAMYDAYAKTMATCPCIGESCPKCCRNNIFLPIGQCCLGGMCTIALYVPTPIHVACSPLRLVNFELITAPVS